MNPLTGAIISKPDYRDSIATATPLTYPMPLPLTFRTDLGSVLMQDQIPDCVSNSVVYCMRLYWFRKTGVWVDFSPRFLDIQSWESDLGLNDGRRPRTVFKVAASQGCCTTATLPNDTHLPLAQFRDKTVITQAMKDEALKYKIPGFIGINLDIQSYRQGVYFYGGVSTLFAVGDQMWSPSWLPKDTDPLRTPNPVTSGHQMTGDGWTTPILNTLQNEWSTAWGIEGRTEWSFQDWKPFVYEAWAVAELPTDLISFLKTLPSPDNFHYQWNTNMKTGDYSEDVKFAQIALMILGFLKPINPTDLGFFGPKTSAAVLMYQQSKGIHPVSPNNIGPQTRTALNSQFSI